MLYTIHKIKKYFGFCFQGVCTQIHYTISFWHCIQSWTGFAWHGRHYMKEINQTLSVIMFCVCVQQFLIRLINNSIFTLYSKKSHPRSQLIALFYKCGFFILQEMKIQEIIRLSPFYDCCKHEVIRKDHGHCDFWVPNDTKILFFTDLLGLY